MDYIVRKSRSILYLVLNIFILLFLFPINKKIKLKINKTLKRYQLINYVLVNKFNKHGKYLEIGCDLDQTYNKVITNRKVGIDPVRGGSLRLSSKEFFENFNNQKFDFIFIDGSHLIEEVFYDTVQSIKNLNVGGYVLLDDVLPNNYLNTLRTRLTLHSFQDAYKILFFLSKLNFIDLYLLPFDHGMALFKLNSSADESKLSFDFNDYNFDDYISLINKNQFHTIKTFEDFKLLK